MAMSHQGHALSSKSIRKAENTDLPLLALRAITEVRDELEHLEITHIESARAKGASWEDIAQALGISRQALQQRLKTRHGRSHREIRIPG